MPTYKFEIDGHKFESDHMLSADEANAIKARFAPPVSQKRGAYVDPSEYSSIVEAHKPSARTYAAMGARIAPVVAAGALTGGVGAIPAAAAMAGAGVLGEVAGSEIESGKLPTAGSVASSAILGGAIPGGSTVPRAAARMAGFGALSETVRQYVDEGWIGDWGRVAFAGTIGALLGGAGKALELRSNLNELTTRTQSDDLHKVFSKEPLTNASPAVKEQEKEIHQAVDQLRMPFKKVRSPEQYEDLTAGIESPTPKPYQPRTQGRFTKPTSEYIQQELPGVPPNRLRAAATPGGKPYVLMKSSEGAPYGRALTGQPLHGEPTSIPAHPFDLPGGSSGIPEDLPTARDFSKETLTDARIKGMTAASRWAVPTGDWFNKAQKQSGLPIYDDIYYPLKQAEATVRQREAEFSKELEGAFGERRYGFKTLINTGRRLGFNDWLFANDAGRAAWEAKAGLGERVRVLRFNDAMQKRFNQEGLDWNDFVRKQIPAIKEAGSPELAFPVQMPKETKLLQGMMAHGIDELDPMKLGIRAVTELENEKLVAPIVRRVSNDYSLTVNPRAPVNEKLPEEIGEPVKAYIRLVNGRADLLTKEHALGWLHIRNMIPGLKQLTEKEAREHSATILMLAQYAGPLSWRPGPLVRNALQSFQTGMMYMRPYWWARGVKAARPFGAGYRFAVEQGALGAEHSLASELTIGKGPISRFARVGMAGYRKVDDYNRAIVFLGTHEKLMNAARRAGRDVDKFVDLADLEVGFREADAARIQQLFAEGNVQEAARQGGIALADRTQFSYAPHEKPPFTTGQKGRLFGAYGTWPAYYGTMLKDTLPTGIDRANRKKMLALGRLVIGTAALYEGATAVSRAAGHKDAGWANAGLWLGLGPLFYTGAPVMESMQQLGKMAERAYLGQKGSMKSLGYAVMPEIPGSYAKRDVEKIQKTYQDRGFGPAFLDALGTYQKVPPPR